MVWTVSPPPMPTASGVVKTVAAPFSLTDSTSFTPLLLGFLDMKMRLLLLLRLHDLVHALDQWLNIHPLVLADAQREVRTRRALHQAGSGQERLVPFDLLQR